MSASTIDTYERIRSYSNAFGRHMTTIVRTEFSHVVAYRSVYRSGSAVICVYSNTSCGHMPAKQSQEDEKSEASDDAS